MTQNRRPTRKRGQSKPESPAMQLTVDGATYRVCEADITPRDVRALRQETGFSWAGLMREMAKDPDVDLMAALVWLARHLAGNPVPYEQLLDEVTYDSEIDIQVEQPGSQVVELAATGTDGPDDLPEA